MRECRKIPFTANAEIIVAERGALQRRASAEDRVVARRRGTNGGARRGRRSAGGTSSHAAVGGAQSSYASRMAQSHPDELLRRALALPPDKRLALATELLNSVEERQDERWEREWLAELDRRSAAIDRGEDKLEDWETVKARLRAELRAKRERGFRAGGCSREARTRLLGLARRHLKAE